MTKELMADWNLIEPSALSDADSTDSDGDTAGSDVAMTDVDAHADGASDADSDAASHVGGPCYTLLDERQLASPQPDTWGHDADAARLLCAACPALREVGFVFKERGTMFAPVRTPQGRVEDVVETGNWINHYFHMFVLGDPEEWKRVYWL